MGKLLVYDLLDIFDEGRAAVALFPHGPLLLRHLHLERLALKQWQRVKDGAWLFLSLSTDSISVAIINGTGTVAAFLAYSESVSRELSNKICPQAGWWVHDRRHMDASDTAGGPALAAARTTFTLWLQMSSSCVFAAEWMSCAMASVFISQLSTAWPSKRMSNAPT